MTSLDSFRCCKTLQVGSKSYAYFSLPTAERNGLKGISRLPFSMKVLLENLLRNEDGRTVTKDDIKAVAEWLKTKTSEREIAFRPARVLMQDFTGVPAVVDLAAMRDAMKHARRRSEEDQSAGAGRSRHRSFGGGDFLRQQCRVQEKRRGGIPAEPGALQIPEMGAALVRQFQRGAAGHRHLPSGQSRIPVARGLDRKDKVKVDGKAATMEVAYPDTLVGTDSHTTMVNGLSVLGWGVGGIEAEAAMLGQPLSMLLPEVIGFKLDRQAERGRHRDRSRAHRHADAAQARRGRQVRRVFRPGPGASDDRRPRHARQHGAGIRRDLRLLPGRRRHHPLSEGYRPAGRTVALVAAYAKAQGMFRVKTTPDPIFTDILKLELELGRALARRSEASAGSRRR